MRLKTLNSCDMRACSHPKASYTMLLPKRRHPTHMAPFSIKCKRKKN